VLHKKPPACRAVFFGLYQRDGGAVAQQIMRSGHCFIESFDARGGAVTRPALSGVLSNFAVSFCLVLSKSVET
jgi:hypothetical protein